MTVLALGAMDVVARLDAAAGTAFRCAAWTTGGALAVVGSGGAATRGSGARAGDRASFSTARS